MLVCLILILSSVLISCTLEQARRHNIQCAGASGGEADRIHADWGENTAVSVVVDEELDVAAVVAEV